VLDGNRQRAQEDVASALTVWQFPGNRAVAGISGICRAFGRGQFVPTVPIRPARDSATLGPMDDPQAGRLRGRPRLGRSHARHRHRIEPPPDDCSPRNSGPVRCCTASTVIPHPAQVWLHYRVCDEAPVPSAVPKVGPAACQRHRAFATKGGASMPDQSTTRAGRSVTQLFRDA
jgi:hypothetical protein